ncbi:S8/S53 family peptidase [bacterium]|nr:S8/S53 family peptidase [candidate division CSSED10-310 bacterium]
MRWIAVLTGLWIPVGVAFFCGTVHADMLTDHEVIQRVSQMKNLSPEGLEVVYRTGLDLPLSAVHGERVKIIDGDATKTWTVAVTDRGDVLDYAGVTAQEREMFRGIYGRLEPALYDELQQMDEADELEVVIWLVSESLEFTPRLDAGRGSKERLTLAETQLLKEQGVLNGEAYIRGLQAQFRDDVLAGRGDVSVGYVSHRAPFLFVTTTKTGVLALNDEKSIDTIYRTTPPEAKSDNINTQVLSHKSAMAWDVMSIAPGTGVGFAHTEDSRPDWNNPYITETQTRVPGDSNVDDHATTCTGIAGSTYSTHRGHAYGCNLYGANGTTYGTADMAAAMDWSVIADVANNSWGPTVPQTTLDFHDRHCDYLVRNYTDTFTTVSGNHSSYVSWMSFNDITVGGVDANDTAAWSDDSMSSFTGYVDPPGTDRELPNVCGDAEGIESTLEGGPPWIGSFGSASGTSYSAPSVGALCVSMIARDTTLNTWPEAVKAIIMATALNNVEGDSRLSEYDGAGMVDALAADTIANGLTNGGDQWGGETVTAASFPFEVSFPVCQGETVRVVICWDSNPSGPPDYTTDPLEADLDLYLRNSGGSVVASSTSADGAYEIVEYLADETADWTMQVTAASFTGSTEYLGYCYWTGNLLLETYAPRQRIAPPESYDNYVINSSLCWQAVACKPDTATADYNIRLYNQNRFDDPGGLQNLAESAYTGESVDFVMIDRNHAPSGKFYPSVIPVSGADQYHIEFAGTTDDIVTGTFGPYTMTSSQIIRVWDLYLASGEMKYVSVIPTTGDADLRLYIFDSDGGTAASWYQDRSSFLYWVNAGGPGEPEFIEPQLATATDWTGLVVFSDSRGYATTTFNVYADTTAPGNGTVVINGSATYTTSRNVTLTLESTDAETGVYEMQIGNLSQPADPWEPYATVKAWQLPDVQGNAGVFAQFRNHAGMESASAAQDQIILDSVGPVTGCTSPASQVGGDIPVSWSSSDATSGLDYTELYVRFGSTGTWSVFTSQMPGTSGIESFTPMNGPGDYWFSAQAVDLAGNLTAFNLAGDTVTIYSEPTATPTDTPVSTITPTATATNPGTATPPPAQIPATGGMGNILLIAVFSILLFLVPRWWR